MSKLVLVAAAALVLPAAGLAKGPSEAAIAGPGIDGPLSFPAYGDLSGLYAVSLRPDRPAGELGPRYTVTWLFPGHGTADERVRQDVYPYATPAPVTYTPPGQRLWGQAHEGGWWISSPRLREVLVTAGLPPGPPAGGRTPSWWPAPVFGLGLAACFGLARWISGIRTPTVSSASTSSTPTTG